MKRLEILCDAKVIQEETLISALKIIQWMIDEYGVSEKDLEVMMTHFTMASERIAKGEIVDEMDQAIFNEISKNENYEKAIQVMDKINDISKVNYPISERQFMLLHICNALKGGEA